MGPWSAPPSPTGWSEPSNLAHCPQAPPQPLLKTSQTAKSRCCASSPKATPTTRSPSSSTWPTARSRTTSPQPWPNSAPATASTRYSEPSAKDYSADHGAARRPGVVDHGPCASRLCFCEPEETGEHWSRILARVSGAPVAGTAADPSAALQSCHRCLSRFRC